MTRPSSADCRRADAATARASARCLFLFRLVPEWLSIVASCSSARSTCRPAWRSEEHTSELQSLMRISYAVFCLKKKNQKTHQPTTPHNLTHMSTTLSLSIHSSTEPYTSNI